MKKITDEELEKLKVKGRGRSTKVFTEIFNLKPNENLVIEPDDWKKKYPPSRVASYIGKKYKRKLSTVPLGENGGWVVRRSEEGEDTVR